MPLDTSIYPKGPKDHRQWVNLQGSATSLMIAQAQADRSQGVSLVIAPNGLAASQLEQEIRFYSSDTVKVLSFPDWETLPYDSFSPHQDIISQRLLTLHELINGSSGILVMPLSTVMLRLAPSTFLSRHTLVLESGQQFDIDKQRLRLEEAGYRCTDNVLEHGEFAVRGSILDMYPMGSELPYRIDLFDDEIDSIRTFDPETQRSLKKVNAIQLLPAKEFPLDESGIRSFKSRWRERFDVDYRQCAIYQDISEGIPAAGIEYYLPLFFKETATIFDYLPENTLIFTPPKLDEAFRHQWDEIKQRYESRAHDRFRPILPPQEVFLPEDAFFASLKTQGRITTHQPDLETAVGTHSFNFALPPELPVQAKSEQPLNRLEDFLTSFSGSVLFCCESSGRRETLLELLETIKVKPTSVDSWQGALDVNDPIMITIAEMENGLIGHEHNIAVITESQLFGQRVMQRRRRSRNKDQTENVVRNLTELRLDAPVVHIDHGVGRYKGLQTINLDGQAAEFLTLEYAGGDKLYVPVASLHLITRYSASGDDSAPLHKLGTEKWSVAKQKAAEKIRDTAAELLDIYARREARPGMALENPVEAYKQFADEFPFEETPDQQAAIDAVIKDMVAPKAMDRLVCGDVGFGKTEVAMRAAFIAMQNGKQVAILAPTTLLAQQHYRSFKDRFSEWPFTVEALSRFKTTKEQNQTIAQLEAGSIDIVIGTHKLLHGKIAFKNLGLLIIDEEHRFGVQQKEKVKSLRSNIDILNLTATPIPRTLNMALSGIRDLSIIATPPAKRLSVKTFVRLHDDMLIKEALLREILRGGQVYFLHNEVKTIEKRAREIAELIPEAKVCIGHGQMSERELEQVMTDFYHKRYNILLCTTIIETGIDIPNANTIIIERSDKFGLAQLHQLRGRVGRSHHQAYAYLLTPSKKNMTADAMKRLDAIENAQDLGAGFTLATHDLEIRGAGELLGEEQSGQIHAIGFSLYMEMLDQAVKAIKEGRTPNADKPLQQGAEINLHLPALIPDDYLPDVHSRLTLYKRISSAQSAEEIKDLKVEMIDRFGLLPDPVKNLFQITELKLKIRPLGISKLDVGHQSGHIEFDSDTTVDPFKIVSLVQAKPLTYKLEGANILKFQEDMPDKASRFNTVDQVLHELTS